MKTPNNSILLNTTVRYKKKGYEIFYASHIPAHLTRMHIVPVQLPRFFIQIRHPSCTRWICSGALFVFLGVARGSGAGRSRCREGSGGGAGLQTFW